MKWTKEQMEALADRFAKVFVDTVEHAGGTATIVPISAPPNTACSRPDQLRESGIESQPLSTGQVSGG